MLDQIRTALSNQYGAGLQMLDACIEHARDDTWAGPVGVMPYWHVAYHVLFYVDLYLSPSEAQFRPQAFHRKNYNFFGPQVWMAEQVDRPEHPYDAATLRQYVGICRTKARLVLGQETDASLAGPSGFHWLPFNRMELHLYNIRHLQHHTGQLSALLRRQEGTMHDWAGSVPLHGA